MPVRDLPERFLVAFSLAGEQRDFVRAIALEVEAQLGRNTVFLDEWFEHYLAGDDADAKLQEIYGRRSELAVACVSAEYDSNPWTRVEHRAIRERLMKCDQAVNGAGQQSVLWIRVGPGEVEGIHSNAIVPDVRSRTVADCVQLIVARLHIVRPDLMKPVTLPVERAWKDHPPPLSWPMADHSGAREAFGDLLTANVPWRLLRIQGASETGKSHVTRQMLANTLAIHGIACGRFDFKGTTAMDRELRAFIQDLEITPSPAPLLHESLQQILVALKQRARPTLLIFDTYEMAGEAQEWVERPLLQSLVRAHWLRVVIAGQQVPDAIGAVWCAVARPTLRLNSPPAGDWFDYGKQYQAGLTLAHVETMWRFAFDKPSVLAQLLGPPS